jgi:chromate transport protein ChrA
MQNGKSSFSGIITGVMLIIVGIIWVLINYGLIKFSIWKFWPLTVIFIGVSILLKEKNFNNPLALIMILLGLSFQIANLEIIKGWNCYNAVNLWPTALIITGISIITKKNGKKNKANNIDNNK